MSPPISISEAKTSYPIFAATFAHNHAGYLVVGGGGGAGRSGVGNKITAFDVSSRAPKLEPSAELELSRDEDSVTCLANLATKDGLVLYAGLNSSPADRDANKNEHFRSFELEYPKKKQSGKNEKVTSQSSEAKISFLSKTSLLKAPESVAAKKDGYQRLLRLSRPKRSANGSKRIGAIASSLAGQENEVVVFNATTSSPRAPGDIIQRISPHHGEEANDLDILEPEDGEFKLVYCTDYSVYTADISYDFSKKKSQEKLEPPRSKYSVPFPDVFEKKGRNKIRCVRWLSPSHILLLSNSPNRTGAELQILRLYGDTMGSITYRKTLPRHIKQATDLDVCALDADDHGAYQIVIGVAGADCSTSIFTIDYKGIAKNSLSGFSHYNTVRDVHPFQITKVVFSPFFSPWTAPNAEKIKQLGPQYLRLASTSLGNTIVVDTMTLQPASKKSRSRFILGAPGSRANKLASYFLALIVLLVSIMLAQPLVDPDGRWTQALVPESIRNVVSSFNPIEVPMDDARAAAHSAIPEAVREPIARTSHRLRDLLHPHHSEKHKNDGNTKALIVRADPETDYMLSTEVHDGPEAVVQQHTEAKRWEELNHEERSWWKEKLTSAGAWTVDEGETVLKSIFFGQIGGFVGQMAQEVLNG
ncbi:hypothetical protein BU16DRAFT_501834 [Lophium mytilinum]|uniref:Guanine nucleotide-exchange factor SEC12 n=1 Tax=Lophium mytilinum TaxID=390894 RepID=A0A6A6R741_9PEZI|nr:hypothetical protein BU16DRAFT_501834 [Lophium mytilinum]